MRSKKLIVVMMLSVGVLLSFYALTVGAHDLSSNDQPAVRYDVLPVLQGRVYNGPVGVQTDPLEGVKVVLYGANSPYPFPGNVISTTYTDALGWYGLPVMGNYEFYWIEEFDPPGKESVGATTVNGTVKTSNIIQYMDPLRDKILTGNKFWDTDRSLTWEKWVDGVAWTSGMQVTTETSNTIQVVDVIHSWPGDELVLVEQWDAENLKLVDWNIKNGGGVVVSSTSGLIVTLPEGNTVYSVTKYFHIEQSTWRETFLNEEVRLSGAPIAEKDVIINKTPPILWINGSNNPSVFAGDVVSFTLEYGNLGGYEIR